MPGDLSFACICGTVTGHLDEKAVSNGTHVTCGCRSCRAATKHLTSKTVPFVDVYLTSSHHVHINSGFDKLAALKLSPKGSNRIYATCCGAPISVIEHTQRLCFTSIYTNRLSESDRIGPIVAQVYRAKPDDRRHIGLGKVVRQVLARALSDRLTGKWKSSVFFSDPKTLTVPQVLIEKDAKAVAYT